ncbi:MAG: peptidyl-prolyl cis-trans isomerase [Planctomycetota bacterium]|nr:MAG: peptidyl-prolyl cis-trans isomerase [Planctomycetota bacterium]
MSKPHAQQPEDPHVETELEGADEIVHVPKGRSPWAWILLVGLSLIMLVTFSVTPSMQGACAGGRRQDSLLRWQRPGHGEQQLNAAEYITLKQLYDEFFTPRNGARSNTSDRDVVGFYLQDKLAEDAGVAITDGELAEILLANGLTAERINAEVAMNRSTSQRMGSQLWASQSTFEEFFRRALRVRRYQELMGMLAANADPAGAEKLWTAERQEFVLDTIEVERTLYEPEARAALPADAELEKWLADLPEVDKNAWKTAAREKGAFAGFRFAAPVEAKALLEKYPRAADADAEALAKAFYNATYFMRFRRSPPLPAEPGKSDTPEEFQRRNYKTFDEVAEQVRAEAPLYEALGKWRDDLAKRIEAGTAVDFAAEAAALGLDVLAPDDARTMEEWNKVEDWGGEYVGWQLNQAESGKVLERVVTTDKALFVVRCIEKQPAQPPPFAEIKDKVAERWIEKRATEIGMGKLNELRQQFVPKPPEIETGKAIATAEAFQAAAAAAGLVVTRREGHDFDTPIEATDRSDLSMFLRTRRNLLTTEPGEVIEPAPYSNGVKLFLVRVESKRPKDMAKMTPADWQALEMRANGEHGRALQDTVFSLDALIKRLNVEVENDALNLKPETEPQGG